MSYKKLYRRRGGFLNRTPWIRRGIKRLPGDIRVPLEIPIRRPSPLGLPVPIRTGRGRITTPDTETKPQLQPVAKRIRKTVKTRTKLRGFLPRLRSYRRYLPTVRRPSRKRNAASMTKIKPMGQGTTVSYYRERKRKSFKRSVMRQAPLQSQLYNQGYRITNDYSTQATQTWKMLDYEDISTTIDNISGYGDATKIFFESGSQEFFISNQALTNAYIYIYHFVYRRDTVKNPGALVTSGLADIYTGNLPTVNTYRITPTMSPSFNAYIKIKRRYFIELGAGRSHIHKATYQWNREWNNEIAAEASSLTDDMSFGGWTKGVFLVVHGEPVNDVTTKTKVVPSSGAIDVVHRERINYRYADPTKPKLEMINNLDLTGITENVMDPATGAVEAQQIA